MKPNLCQDRYLAAGMGLFAACLALGRFAHAALGQFLSGALAGLSLLLIWVSIIQNTRRGRALLARAGRFKARLLGRGA